MNFLQNLFQYATNDDTAIMAILSGAYNGSPDGHCIQLLYPLGWLISGLYRLCPVLPWFGLFLFFCQLLSVGGIVCFIAAYISDKTTGDSVLKGKKSFRLWLGLALTLAISTVILPELFYIQYTVSSGLLMCFAAVSVFTVTDVFAENSTDSVHSDKNKLIKKIILRSILAALAVTLAWCLRNAMAKMLMPFLLLTVIYKLWDFFVRKNKSGLYFLLFPMVAIILIGTAQNIDSKAYEDKEWHTFRKFFDDRTDVYDYYGVPSYDSARELYEELSLDEKQVRLLQLYDYELDPALDEDVIGALAEYGRKNHMNPLRRAALTFVSYIKGLAVGNSEYYGPELIFPFILLALFIWNIFFCFKNRKSRQLVFTLLVMGGFVAIFAYILSGGRIPERITHPLYLMSMVLLLCTAIESQESYNRKYFLDKKLLISGALILLCLCANAYSLAAYRIKHPLPDEFESLCDELDENADYIVDVNTYQGYGSSLFSEKDAFFRNWDLAGGWCVKSPLQKTRLSLQAKKEKYLIVDPDITDPLELGVSKAEKHGRFDIYKK